MAFNVIGKPNIRDKEGYQILTGKMMYAADNLPGQKLIARILESPYPHAKITSIDTSKAEAYPGVKAVVTYKDSAVFSTDIRFWGQEVAAVAAVDSATAARATQLIDVKYEVIPFVSDPDEAAKPGAPLTGFFAQSNLGPKSTFTRGDADKAIANADIVADVNTGWTNYFPVQPLEPHAAVASWLGDELHLWVSGQTIFGPRAYVAGFLQMPQHKVHVYSQGSGGGFGDKTSNFNHAVIPAVLAKKAGQPVLLHLSRRESFLNRGGHLPRKTSWKIGTKKDGTLVAAIGDLQGDNAGGTGDFVPFNRTYKCADLKFTGTQIATNKIGGTAWRGPPDHTASFVMMVAMTKLAEKLDMDPLQLCYKNIVTPEMPDQDSKKILSSNSIKETLDGLANAIGWNEKWHKPGTKTLADGRLHGIGLHAHVSHFGNIGSEFGMSDVATIINLTQDGKALLNLGLSRNHQNPTTQCHIAAEMIGLNLEDVGVVWGKTDYSFDGGLEGGSTRTITLGSATYRAALSIRNQAFEKAAPLLKVTPDELDAAGGKIFVKADPTKFKTYTEVVTKGGYGGGGFIGTGYSWRATLQRPYLGFPVGTPCVNRTMPGAAYEVAVDPETGVVEILKMVSHMDVGTAIYRRGVEREMEGGSECQIRQTIYHEALFDHTNGAYLNPNYTDNTMPTSLDDPAPDKRQLIIYESDDACGPYGAKGLGEPAAIPIAALAQAIYNAIGVWPDSLPYNPTKILKALGKA